MGPEVNARMETASLFLYLKTPLDEAIWKLLEQRLRKIPGVVAPWFNPNRARFFLIYYNPERVQSRTLLKNVRKFGYEARIVGL